MFTDTQKKAIDNQLRENRADIVELLLEVPSDSDRWWSLKQCEMNLSKLIMFGTYEEKNRIAQIE